jgi:hypothetical protein
MSENPEVKTGESSEATLGTILKRLDALSEEVGELREHKDAELHEVRYEITKLVEDIADPRGLNWLRSAAAALAGGDERIDERFSFSRDP